jgi:hypothetical protein
LHPALRVFLVFVFALFVGDRLIALVLHQVVERSRDRYVQMYNGASPAEIVVIGNSRAAGQFPPSMMRERLGARVVNLGLGGVSMAMSEILFRDYVEHNGPPRLLLIEPQNLVVDPGSVGDMRIFAIFSGRLRDFVREHLPTHHWAGEVFHLFRYNTENLVRLLYGVVRTPEDRLYRGVITPELITIVNGRNESDLVDFPENHVALERIIEFARSQGVEVAVVSSPYLKEQLRKLVNYREWYDRLAALEGNGVRVWDYAALLDDSRFFKDSIHLNAEGSAALLDAMLKDGVFNVLRTSRPDRHAAML